MNDINPRAKLFQQARTEYSRHGEQTQDAVAKATGINRSFIQRMEDEHNFSNGAAETTAILARYYGVSTDYLLGLTEAPYANDHAADQLGLSAAAIQRIQALAQTEQKQLFEELLLSDEFNYFLTDLFLWLAATEAEYVFSEAEAAYEQLPAVPSKENPTERDYVRAVLFKDLQGPGRIKQAIDDCTDMFSTEVFQALHARYEITVRSNSSSEAAINDFLMNRDGKARSIPQFRKEDILLAVDALLEDLSEKRNSAWAKKSKAVINRLAERSVPHGHD